ncbi:metallophosphoesterase family protein [Aliisedimentitalea scapharcae]|uniref:Metallophosphoesterase family protein n=1 Tax=Aliisedimentitalea scapharcae TaxID=1524259 RepID=A0ABZ2XMI3_9RHOB
MKSLLFASTLAVMLPSLGAADGSDPKPWTHQNFDADPGKFTFAIHADLTGGERPGIFATAMAQLNLLRPDFVISVGDLIEGGEIQRDQFEAEWEAYDNRVRSFPGPIFYVGGNHDLSTDLSREVWAERYGPTYYHFRYKNVLFLVLDTEDTSPADRVEIAKARAKAIMIYQSDGPEAFAQTEYANLAHRTAGTIGDDQRNYFLEAIEHNTDVRWTFLFLHKPAWQHRVKTPFASIEAALSERPYTVFNGHVQAYGHEVRNGRDYVQLATTGGEQFPDLGLSEDHVTLVTMTNTGPNIANLMLSGIRDKTGAIPRDGGDLCFSVERCGDDQ